MKMKKQAMVLSAALSIASLTGSVASCVAGQPAPRTPADIPAAFCYQTLGEITCYSAPQPQMGPVVALSAEPKTKVEPAPGDAKPDTASLSDQPVPPATNPLPNATDTKPISIKPDA